MASCGSPAGLRPQRAPGSIVTQVDPAAGLKKDTGIWGLRWRRSCFSLDSSDDGGEWLRPVCSGWGLAAWPVCVPGSLAHPATVDKALSFRFTASSPRAWDLGGSWEVQGRKRVSYRLCLCEQVTTVIYTSRHNGTRLSIVPEEARYYSTKFHPSLLEGRARAR